jgi:hypothetical protein
MNILDRFKVFNREPFHPATQAVSIVPSDSSNLVEVPRAIYIGGNGNLRVTMLDGNIVTFPNVVAGTVIPIRVQKVWSTSTTATGIIGLY